MQQTDSWKKKAIIFLVSQGVTLFGSTLVQMAIIWYVTLQTSSGVWISALTICSYIPQMLISFFAGVWADRYDRKYLIISADGIIAVATLFLACLSSHITSDVTLLITILAVSVIRSLGAGVQAPAVNAMIPQLVPEEQLMRFNGINATLQSIVQFAAPAAAGALLTLSTFQSVLFIDVATAAAGIGLLARICIPKNEKIGSTEQAPTFSDMKQGIEYSLSDGFIKRLLLIYSAFIFLSIPSGFLSALLVSRTFGESYTYLTVVEMIGFIGMAASGLVLGIWGGFKNRNKTLLVGLAAYAIFSVMMGFAHNFIVFTIIVLCLSYAIPMVQSAIVTLVQEKTEQDMQGRVFGLLSVAYSGFLPIGMAIFGPIADHISVQELMIITGALLLVVMIALRLQKSFYQNGLTE